MRGQGRGAGIPMPAGIAYRAGNAAFLTLSGLPGTSAATSSIPLEF